MSKFIQELEEVRFEGWSYCEISELIKVNYFVKFIYKGYSYPKYGYLTFDGKDEGIVINNNDLIHPLKPLVYISEQFRFELMGLIKNSDEFIAIRNDVKKIVAEHSKSVPFGGVEIISVNNDMNMKYMFHTVIKFRLDEHEGELITKYDDSQEDRSILKFTYPKRTYLGFGEKLINELLNATRMYVLVKEYRD